VLNNEVYSEAVLEDVFSGLQTDYTVCRQLPFQAKNQLYWYYSLCADSKGLRSVNGCGLDYCCVPMCYVLSACAGIAS
jgi:hypothetical protein